MQETIVTYIRGGATDYSAAEAAGISARTFYDWLARGEGRHPDRPPTPKLVAFAKAVCQAKAQARIGAEVRVYQERPAFWLAHAARTKPEREGWTDPAKAGRGDDGDPPSQLEQRLAELDAEDEIDRRCPDPACPCALHRRGEDGTRRPNSTSD
jgi:hypothetical protein